MDTNTGNNTNTKSSGLVLNRLMLSRQWDSSKIIVDHSPSQKSSTISNGSSNVASLSTAGPLTRTLQQIGKFFNSGISSVSASVIPSGATAPALHRKVTARTESFSRDLLAPPMNESFSRRDSFGRTYSFSRHASFSHSNSFTKTNQGN